MGWASGTSFGRSRTLSWTRVSSTCTSFPLGRANLFSETNPFSVFTFVVDTHHDRTLVVVGRAQMSESPRLACLRPSTFHHGVLSVYGPREVVRSTESDFPPREGTLPLSEAGPFVNFYRDVVSLSGPATPNRPSPFKGLQTDVQGVS